MFRFEGLDVWKKACDVTEKLFDIADELEVRHRFRYAEQLRSAALSVTNNIAEGSGSSSKPEFRQFLNFSHRSTFECANMLLMAQRRKYVTDRQCEILKMQLEEVSKMVIGFSRSL